MSYLRLGYLLATIPYDTFAQLRVLELGPGSGVFFKIIGGHVAELSGYDIVSDSPFSTISFSNLRNQPWDLVCAFDVIEHIEDIDDLWKIDFTWGYFSIPSPPSAGVQRGWRHFKPNEHLWYITAEQFRRWAIDHGYNVVSSGCPEDCLRQRWDPSAVNINSFIICKDVNFRS